MRCDHLSSVDFPCPVNSIFSKVESALTARRTVMHGVDFQDDAPRRQEHEVHAVGAVHADQRRCVVRRLHL